MAISKPTAPFALLAEVSRGLAVESLDYEATIAAVARLALPYPGSWCAVDIREEGRTMRRLAVIHPDPAKQALARELESGWPPERDDPLGAPAVMRTRRTVVIPRVDDEMLVTVARKPGDLHALRALGIGSLIIVPLVARDSVLGAITFVSATFGHLYDAGDCALAEHVAAVAALALDNARLHRAALGRAESEAANRARLEFLATMSHEMRTPINAILGYAELLQLGLAGAVNAEQRDFLSRVNLSATHLAALVAGVLDLAKVEAGQLPVAREPGMTAGAVAAALSLTLPAAEAEGVRLIDAHADEPAGAGSVPYVGDEQYVRQVLVNLLANAVKFTPRGGTVTVSYGTTSDAPLEAALAGSGPWAFIRVTDTGSGVPLGQQATVFEPFVQGDGGLTRTKGGAGLGLTISRRLARLMGGDLTLASAPGDGAAFTLWLPALGTKDVAGGGVAESADARISRALRTGAGYRVYGLAEIGTHVRRRVEGVLESVAARLRSDPAFPQASRLRRSELEDHQLAFLTDVVHSLVIIDETGGVESALYRDGSEIQRVVSGLHGRMRYRQGWTAAQLEHESAIMAEEVEALIRRHVPEGMGDVTTALAVMRHLVEQAQVTSAQAYRQAAQGSGA